MGVIASQITSLTTVYSTVYPGEDQRKHQSSAPLAFVRGIHRGLVNSPHKWPVTRKMFPFDDVIMPRNIVWWPRSYLHFLHIFLGYNRLRTIFWSSKIILKNSPSQIQIIACRLFGSKPLSESYSPSFMVQLSKSWYRVRCCNSKY